MTLMFSGLSTSMPLLIGASVMATLARKHPSQLLILTFNLTRTAPTHLDMTYLQACRTESFDGRNGRLLKGERTQLSWK
jgi:hypothetical protein